MRRKGPRTDVPSISRRQVIAYRLARHHLLERMPRGDLVSAVRDVCGIQAQLLPAAQTSLWARIEGLRIEDIERALWRDRTLVRTWAMRWTVHLLPSADFPMYVSVMRRALLEDSLAWWFVRQGVSREQLEAITDAIVEALADGPLTRAELTQRVGPKFPPKIRGWLKQGWGGLLKPSCLAGRVCFGPPREPETTFVRRDRWLPDWEDVSPERAEADLFRRYLRAYGPARSTDFTYWSGVRTKLVAAIRARLGNELVELENGKGVLLREDLPFIQAASPDQPSVRLLPSFDAYLLGHRDKSDIVEDAHYKRVYRKAGWLSPVVLVDGRVAGVWSHARKGRQLAVRIEAFDPLSAKIRTRITEEAEDLRRFLEIPEVAVSFT